MSEEQINFLVKQLNALEEERKQDDNLTKCEVENLVKGIKID